jgi:hypothetical protein
MMQKWTRRGAISLAVVTGLAGTAVMGSAVAAPPVTNARAGTVEVWGAGSGLPLASPTADQQQIAFAKVVPAGYGEVAYGLTAAGKVLRLGTPFPAMGVSMPGELDTDVATDVVGDGMEGGAAITDDHRLVVWGNPDIDPAVADAPTDTAGYQAVSIEAGSGVMGAAVKTDGSVVAWGTPPDPSLIDEVESATSAARVTVGSAGGVVYVIKTDGTVEAYGNDSQGQLDLPPVLTDTTDAVNVLDVVGNSRSALALLSDGSVVAWGADTDSSSGSHANAVPASLSEATDVTAIAGDGSNYFAATASGQFVQWGESTAAGDALPTGVDASSISQLAAGQSVVTAVVTKVLPIAKPTVSGTAKVGQTLTATPGTFSGGVTADQVSGQWFAGGQKIEGATNTTYVPTTADVGKTLTYESSAPDGDQTVTSDSAPTAAVAAASTDGGGGTVVQPPAGGGSAAPPALTSAQQKLAKDEAKLKKDKAKLKKAKKAYKKAHGAKKAKLKKKVAKLKKKVKKDKKVVKADK